MSKRAFVLPNWATLSREDVVYYAQLGEELGYDSIWVPETWGHDAFTLLTTIIENTSKIKVATGIVSIFSRSPASITQTIATIDTFSGGRAMLGLGVSTNIVNENWHGSSHTRPLTRIREYIEIIRLILSGERVNYKGELFNLKNLKLQSKPLRRKIPIYIASLGPKALKLTGEIADGWLPFLCPEEHIIKLKNHIEVGTEIAGRRLDDISIYAYVPALVSNENIDEADYKIKEFISFYMGAMGPHYNKLVSEYGFKEDALKIREAWKNKEFELCVNSVSNELLDLVSVHGTRKSATEKN